MYKSYIKKIGVPKTKLDYVEIYARKLKEDNSYFEQQKMLIESQMRSSSSLFKKMFGSEFKTKARAYLKGVGLI